MRHLDVAGVVALHADALAAFGEAPLPLLRRGDLESAINRTRMAERYDDETDVIRLAALLAVGISQAQAFLDGNKRTAFAALDTFLDLDGVIFTGDPQEVSERLTRAAERTGEREAAERDFEAWLRGAVAPVAPPARLQVADDRPDIHGDERDEEAEQQHPERRRPHEIAHD